MSSTLHSSVVRILWPKNANVANTPNKVVVYTTPSQQAEQCSKSE